MIPLVVVGLNHRTAPIEFRERLHFSGDEASRCLVDMAQILSQLTTDGRVEVALLSTCNRTEIYAWIDVENLNAPSAKDASQLIASFLASTVCEPSTKLERFLFVYHDLEAVHHLMMVAAGLDSLVTGENEILGQVKQAYDLSLATSVCGPMLSALFRQAIECGKNVRSNTELGCLRRSVATVVVDLAQEMYPNLANRTALLIGAGKISAMTAHGLAEAGLRCILAANRTYDRACQLANAYGGQAVHFDALPDSLVKADIVICSTSAPHAVLHTEMVRKAQERRNYSDLLVADLAVPRDVDPAAATIPGVHLVDIDKLERLVQTRLPLAADVLECAQSIVSQKTEDFARWMISRDQIDLIRRLQIQVDAICAAQVDKTARHWPGLDSEGRKALDTLARTVAAQILHAPMRYIKTKPQDMSARELEKLVQKVFDLHPG